jgi:hypothetical protein
MADERGKVVPLWMAVVEEAVEKFRGASIEEQEVICVGLGEKCRTAEVAKKARELFAAARPKPVEGPKPVDGGWRFVQRADGSKWMVRGNDWRRHFGPMPQLKVVEQAKPEPEPEPEKPEEEAKDRGGPEPRAEPKDSGRPIRLILDHPYDIARTFVRSVEDKEGKKRYIFIGRVEGKLISEPILWHWRSDFKRWNGQCYEDVEDDQIRAQVYDFLDQAVEPGGGRIKPKPKNVNEVIEAGTNRGTADAPHWIEVEDGQNQEGC